MFFRARQPSSSSSRFTNLRRRPPHRSLQLELLESRKLLAARLAVNTPDYSHSRLIVRFDSQNAPTALVGSMLQNDVVLSQSGNVHRFDLRSGYTMEQAIAALTSATGVIFAQPDRKLQFSLTPNDPYYAQQWDLNNTASNSGGTADADIDAPEAWNTQLGSSSTLVAIIDTGIDYNHPDLKANIWTNTREIAGNGRDDDGNGYIDDIHGYDFANEDSDPMDDNQHGTHVAGTIGAVGNNGIGVAGVNWNVKMMALKFLDADGSGYDSDAIRALDYAVKMGAKVSNNSWGGGGRDQAMADAIERARVAGHIFVAAAGNDGRDNDRTANYPSNYTSDNIIAVAATGADDSLASWSNWGATTVDIAAPGVKILSTLPGNRYGTLSGTSMATPHVVGAVALVMSQNPTYTYRQVIDKVLSSVDKLPNLSGRVVTGGRLNAAKALAVTQPPALGPYALSTGARGTSGNITSIVTTFDKAIDPASVSLGDIVSFTSPTGVNWMSKITGISVSGSQITITFTPVTEMGRSRITFGPDIRDLAGNKMNQDRDGVAGEVIEDRWVASFSNPGTFSFASTTQIPIPDKKTITSTIQVTRDVRIADLNVMVNIRHSYDRDLVISLTSPQGRTITLINRQGGSADNFNSTLLDDEATRAISTGVAPFTGSYRPDSPLTAFDTLGGQGTWRLTISDVTGLDSGTLLGWSLNFTSYNSIAGAGGTGVRGISAAAANESAAVAIVGDASVSPRSEGGGYVFWTIATRNDPEPAVTNLFSAAVSLADRAIADMSARASFASRRVTPRV